MWFVVCNVIYKLCTMAYTTEDVVRMVASGGSCTDSSDDDLGFDFEDFEDPEFSGGQREGSYL